MLSYLTETVPDFWWAPEYDILPTEPTYGVRALFFRSLDYQGRKTRVFAYYSAPAHRAGERVPAVVLVHGGCGTAFDLWVKQWCDRGYAAIAMDTTGQYPNEEFRGKACPENLALQMRTRGEEGDYVSPPKNDQCQKSGPLEEMWLYHAVSAVILAHSLLRSFPEIDPGRTGIMGISWGGVLTSHAIAYDRRFAFAIPVYGSSYLATGDSKINRTYRTFGIDRLMDAQAGLADIPFPVLWLCHDSDYNFSIDANTRSYLATRDAGAVLAISNMGHSATSTWRREEPFPFADRAIGRGEGLALRTVTEPSGLGAVSFRIAYRENAESIRAVCHYLNTPMRFDETGKYDYEWLHLPAVIEGDTVSFTLPEDAMSYYVSLHWTCDGKAFSISTCYIAE